MCHQNHKAKVLRSRLRCMHQGEVLEQQFGEAEVAFRTLDLYTSAVLEASLNPTNAPKAEWRSVMAQMSQVCCSAQQSIQLHDLLRLLELHEHPWRACSSLARRTARSSGVILASSTTSKLLPLSMSLDGSTLVRGQRSAR